MRCPQRKRTGGHAPRTHTGPASRSGSCTRGAALRQHPAAGSGEAAAASLGWTFSGAASGNYGPEGNCAKSWASPAFPLQQMAVQRDAVRSRWGSQTAPLPHRRCQGPRRLGPASCFLLVPVAPETAGHTGTLGQCQRHSDADVRHSRSRGSAAVSCGALHRRGADTITHRTH